MRDYTSIVHCTATVNAPAAYISVAAHMRHDSAVYDGC